MRIASMGATFVAFLLVVSLAFANGPIVSAGPTIQVGEPTFVTGAIPCSKVRASLYNKLLRKQAEYGGSKVALRTKPVCLKTYDKRKALVRKYRRECLRSGPCRWRLEWRKLAPSDRTWALRIGNCESGNNPTTNTGNGFYGAHQWVLSTWHSAGGSGNPITASYDEQAVRAVWWRNRTSTMQWPACSVGLGYA